MEESDEIQLNEDFIWIVDWDRWEKYQSKYPVSANPWNYIFLTEGKEYLSKNIVSNHNYAYFKYVLKYPLFLKYKQILVVDDDWNQLKLVKKLLSSVGLKPFCIQNFKNLKRGLQLKPHLVILDLYVENGKIDYICKDIKKSCEYEIPIIFISGSDKKEDIVRALEWGANDYIKKPFFFEEFLARIGVQFRIQYMYEENQKFLATQEKLTKNLLDLLEESRLQKQQIERMNQLLKQKSIIDPLTQVFNRGYLFHVLKREIARVQRYEENLSLIMFDIDFFKKINDTYGHAVGDLVLKGVVELIKKRIRTSDIVARYGGEEFVVLLTNTSLENACKVAEQIRKTVEGVVFKTREGKKIKTSVSGSVATYRLGESFDDFFIRLDENLYKAKRGGRNQIVFS